MTHNVYAAIVAAFIIGFLLIVATLILWAGHDRRLDDHDGKFAVLEAAVNLGGTPLVVVDEPITQPIAVPTEPMERVDVIGGRRTRPSPYPRGRHRAQADETA